MTKTSLPDENQVLNGNKQQTESGTRPELRTLNTILGASLDLLTSEVSASNPRIPTLEELEQMARMSAAADDTVEPPIDEEEKKFQERLLLLQNDFRVSIETPFPPEVCMLEIDGVGFFAKGDIHAIKAKQKQGKTHAVAIYIAAILCGQWGRVKGIVPNARILLIDTEQKPVDTQSIYHKVLELAKLPLKDDYNRLEVYTLRKRTIDERLEDLKTLIKACKPDIIFLDGLVDLCHNFNEVEESKTLVEELSNLSTEYDCAIVSTLHTNKALEDDNMRGHLGTILAQKGNNTIECKKSKEGIFSVLSADERHAPIPCWSYRFGSAGELICADEEKRQADIAKALKRAEKNALEKKQRQEESLKVFKQIFVENSSTMDIIEIKKLYADKIGKSIDTARNHYKKLIAAGELVEELGDVRLAGAKEQQEKYRD